VLDRSLKTHRQFARASGEQKDSMIQLAKLDRVETKLRNELAAKRKEYQQKATADALAEEFGITYDKACELLMHYDYEQVMHKSAEVLGVKYSIKYVARSKLNGLLAFNDKEEESPKVDGTPFMIEDLCDADD